MRKVSFLLILAIVVVALGAGGWPALRAYWRWREQTPIGRGARLARSAGCFSCHGPDGGRGLPDPNGGDVPVWDGGVPMMYVSGAAEIREYIEDGVSKRRAMSASAATERGKAGIRMPAYEEVLSGRQIDDLTAYVVAVAGLQPLDDPRAAQGRDLVARFRCEACHGVGGSGGVANPGSFKGYVPGWLGADFADLVRDDAELRAWIREGGIERFAGDRLATYFLARQRLQMPAYRKALTDTETEAIVSYIKTLRGR